MNFKFLIIIVVLFIIVSCKQPSETSVYQNFSLDSKNLPENIQVGVYLPAGYSADKEFPVIYSGSADVFLQDNYKHVVDSLIMNGYIKPVVIACTMRGEDSLTAKSLNYFADEFIPAIESKYSVSKDNRYYFGVAQNADLGILLSMTNHGLIRNYWCFSPCMSTCEGYDMLSAATDYRICWSLKEQFSDNDDRYQNLILSIRKRGGRVHTWTYSGADDREYWKDEFVDLLSGEFGYVE